MNPPKSTVVYGQHILAYNSGRYNGFVHEGGSRSSKTTSIIQFFLQWAERQNELKRVVVARYKNTWTSATVLYDFTNLMKAYGVYDEKKHNQTKGIVTYGSVEFWFGGLDDPQRIHGFTSDAFWLNEANEASKDDFDQLEMRCKGFFVLDYNPRITEDHWIPVNVLKRKDVKYIHSTVFHNPFAPEASRRKIMSYQPTEENILAGTADKNKWEVYGLGKRDKIEGLVYEGYEIVSEIPYWISKRYQAIDFGYTSDPTAIAEVAFHENTIFIDEHVYRTHMLTSDIIKALKKTNTGIEIVSESADPRMIDEISLAGFRITPVEKGPGSVKAGIDKMKSMKICITARSVNAKKELDNYKYAQDRNGKWQDEPEDDFNHILDAVRYVVLMKLLGRSQRKKNLQGMFH